MIRCGQFRATERSTKKCGKSSWRGGTLRKTTVAQVCIPFHVCWAVPRLRGFHGFKTFQTFPCRCSEFYGGEMLHQAQARRLKPNCMAVGNFWVENGTCDEKVWQAMNKGGPFIFGFFCVRCWFFPVFCCSAFLLCCFSALLLVCFSAFLLLCFSGSLLFCLLVCFSACFSPFLLFFSLLFCFPAFLLLCCSSAFLLFCFCFFVLPSVFFGILCSGCFCMNSLWMIRPSNHLRDNSIDVSIYKNQLRNKNKTKGRYI